MRVKTINSTLIWFTFTFKSSCPTLNQNPSSAIEVKLAPCWAFARGRLLYFSYAATVLQPTLQEKKNYIILWLGHKAIPIDILLITAFTWSTYDCISGSKLIASNKLVTKKRMTSTVRLEAHICTCGMDIAWTNNNGSNVVLLISNLTLEFRSSLILSW